MEVLFVVYFVYYLIGFIVIVIDQWTKWLVVHRMEIGESIEVIKNFLYITSHRNSGAAWGILQGQMWFFYLITVIVIITIIYFIQKMGKDNKLFGISLGLILGGAIGNFIDRLLNQQVVDFINTYIFGYDFPIFNIADSALVIGVALFIVQILLEDRKAKGKTNGENDSYRQ